MPASRRRSLLVVATHRLDDLLAIALPIAQRPAHEIILARFLRSDEGLADENAALSERRDVLERQGVASRVAVFTTTEPGVDAIRLATEHDVDLVLLDGAPEPHFSDDLEVVLEHALCDVAVLVGGAAMTTGPIVTPFGGVEHDWSAIELAAWLAQSLGTTLRLVGTTGGERRDASRLLSRASMLIQQVVGIVAEPVLVPAGEAGFLEAAAGGRLLVVGLSDRWRTEGIGRTRLAVALEARAPTLFVKRGLRPSGIAPSETLTRFTWTLGADELRSRSR